ncbi:MAG: type IV pilus assembly protein PilM [Patescibacteria group bacterium]|nr:type IV pilus assembly protein PilM [Patescibacteria group bacterium]
MQNPFNLFERSLSGAILGVDIGTTSIKMAEVRNGSGKPLVSNYGLLESSGYLARANQALQTSSLKIFESEVIELLRALVRIMGTPAVNAIASLPPFSVFTTVLDFPQMAPQEVEQALRFQAQQYVPLPLSEVSLDWMKVGEFQDDQGFIHQKIFLTSVPNEQINKYNKMFAAAGLRLSALETESLSLARLFGGDPTPTILVDIGSRSTNIVFFEGGGLVWNTQSDFGGASLTQALASSLGLNPLRAEELKKERGIVGTGPSYELSTIMMPFVDAIINEVKKAQFAYGQQFPLAKKTERVMLAGGGANLLGVEKYFEREFGVPVVKAAPFVKFEYPGEIQPLVPELAPLMSVALGLGMRNFM